MAVIICSYQRVSYVDDSRHFQERYFVRCRCGMVFACAHDDFYPDMECVDCIHQLMNQNSGEAFHSTPASG